MKNGEERVLKANCTKVFLAVPPVWELSFQSVGIPALTAWCREHGFDTESSDLNIAFARDRCGDVRIDPASLYADYQQILQDDKFRSAYLRREIPSKIRLPLAFGFAELVCNNYSRLFEFLEDERHNPFIDFSRNSPFIQDIAAVAAHDPVLVGFGWDSENQLVATLTLAREIKRRRPQTLIALGGPWTTAMRDALSEAASLLSDIDYIIPKKGEVPLLNLLRQIEKSRGRPDAIVPGVMQNQGDAFSAFLPDLTKISAAELPRPAVFPLRDYQRWNVLPYESERGCYWGKCRFCHHILTYTHGHNSKPIEKVIADLKAYREEFDYDVAAFVDAAMPPKRVKEIAQAFLDDGMDLRWAGFSRPEKNFTPEIFKLARRSGLDVISFGVEHASRRVLEFIGKPQQPDVMRRVLRDCADAGIYTTAGVMNGLPSETFADLEELVDFLDKIKDFVYLHPHMFKFERGSEFFENSASYGIEVIPNHPESRLSIYYDYEDRNGGETRDYIRDNNFNQEWWRRNMRRTLNWKSHNKGFCKTVEFIVDH